MGHTNNSIVIKAPYERIFEISNDIERWTELFGGEYKEAKILKREGNKITFSLTDNEGRSWQSFRLLFKEHYLAYAQKLPPEFPFKYMKIIWLYTPQPDGILMTWIQHFQMDAKAGLSDSKVEEMINKHSRENMQIFKRVIEQEAGS
jgi:aromatase